MTASICADALEKEKKNAVNTSLLSLSNEELCLKSSPMWHALDMLHID